MRALCKDILTALFMGMILPGVLVNGAVKVMEPPKEIYITEPVQKSISCPVLVRTGETVTAMDMEDYITGVVFGEMPASFAAEALKAQSVAARTYAAKAALTGGKHGDGSVCTDPKCCQGYRDPAAASGREAEVEKIAGAVEATSGWVLTYEEALIEATYFSCSGGRTEDALAVWGTEYPYLRSVSSPGEDEAAVYQQTRVFTPQEFQQALGVSLRGDPESWFSITTYTAGGGVAEMSIGGQVYSGTRLRSLLGLRSTAFTVAVQGDKIAVTTQGYGHRVGMSQYGADAMAANGSTWREILAHYYPGTGLKQLEIDKTGDMTYSK